MVPVAPELTTCLPELRTTVSNTQAKALHSSSHRGLSTLHRSIASCSCAEATNYYANSILLAAQLARTVASGNYDVG